MECNVDQSDSVAMAESWNDYTDGLCKDGQLCALQYQHAPAYDESMPGNGSRWDALSDDRDFILAAMKVEVKAEFVPFSKSRNKAEKSPSLNWRVTLTKNGKDLITTDYMQGCGHCPAGKKTFNSPSLNPATEKRQAIAHECETGRVYGRLFANFDHRQKGAAIAPPSAADILYSLMSDGSAIDAGTFDDWCDEFGYDVDSIKARGMYDQCLQTGLRLRAAFGDSTLSDLRDLFEGM